MKNLSLIIFLAFTAIVNAQTFTTNSTPVGMEHNILFDATEVKVALHENWPDYVFTKEYKLPKLQTVASYIKENGHLPNMPSAKVIKESQGFKLGEMKRKLLEKIEELTLYTIEQEKKLEKMKELELRLKKLETLIQSK